jgi:hypothetical protein
MKTLSGNLALCALITALLATPVFAKSTRHRHVRTYGYSYGYTYSPQYGYSYTPPPPNLLYAPQYGNAYTPIYVPGFGNIGSNGDSISGSGSHY